jgi:hypothetical protein
MKPRFFGAGPPLAPEEVDYANEPTTEELALLHAVYSRYGVAPFYFRNRQNKSIAWDLVAVGYLAYVGSPRGVDTFRITHKGLVALREFGLKPSRPKYPGLLGRYHDYGNPFLSRFRRDEE